MRTVAGTEMVMRSSLVGVKASRRLEVEVRDDDSIPDAAADDEDARTGRQCLHQTDSDMTWSMEPVHEIQWTMMDRTESIQSMESHMSPKYKA